MINRPIINQGEHPIETGNYHIVTNEIIHLCAVMHRWISNRVPGAIIYGRPRLGKTKAIEYLKVYLKSEFGETLPIFTMLCSYHKPNENRFFTELLRDVGHSAFLQGKPEAKKDRLLKFFIQQAENSGHHKIILFIDEAHMLYEQDYNWLIDIYNQLDRCSINLTVILVGQKDLIHQKSAFISGNKMQIVGRFMVQEQMFSGVKTANDLKICLNSYDNTSEYPIGSGFSFTRYFFPEAFDDGNRFVNEAEAIFDRFKKLRSEAKIRGNIEIPMLYITLAIDNCFKIFGANGKGSYWPTLEDWDESIIRSGYIEAETYTTLP